MRYQVHYISCIYIHIIYMYMLYFKLFIMTLNGRRMDLQFNPVLDRLQDVDRDANPDYFVAKLFRTLVTPVVCVCVHNKYSAHMYARWPRAARGLLGQKINTCQLDVFISESITERLECDVFYAPAINESIKCIFCKNVIQMVFNL